jgi:hypothetical protein
MVILTPSSRRGQRGRTVPGGKGGYQITLPHDVLNKLNYVREPGQSYSDVMAKHGDAKILYLLDTLLPGQIIHPF